MLERISKDSIIAFFLGVITGIFMTFVFLGGMYAVYKVGKAVGHRLLSGGTSTEVREVASKVMKRTGGGNKFVLNFENKKDLEFFSPQDGVYVEQSKEFVTQGKYSLLAEYPQGATYPGLHWEVYNKRFCLNWSGKDYFVFDVHNGSDTDVNLIVKFKSGPSYPKNKYQTYVNIPANQSKKAMISLNELRNNNIDTSQISYINLFLNRPKNTVTLYFDNIHLE